MDTLDANIVLDRMKVLLSCTTDAELSEKLSKPRTTVSAWRTKNSVPYQLLVRLSQQNDASVDWFLTGEGPMYRDQLRALSDKKNEDFVQVPEYDLHLSAGSGAYPDDHALAIKSRVFSKKWIVSKGLREDKLVLARVMGDSMEPLLKNQDLVLIDRARTIPNDAMPFAVRLGDALYIKMVQRLADSVRLSSLNKLYDVIEVDLSKPDHNCEIIGGIAWHAHTWV